MTIAKFKEVNPILPVRDVELAVRYYAERLGFRVSFRDRTHPSNYVGVRRDGVELHLQWHKASDISPKGILMLRFIVDDPDALFVEYREQGVFHERTELGDKPWGTREFAFFDLNGHGLTFYRDL